MNSLMIVGIGTTELVVLGVIATAMVVLALLMKFGGG